MSLGALLMESFGSTIKDVVPIVAVVLFFQLAVLRRRIANWRKVCAGIGWVVLGMAMFLVGLELALFPLGKAMATQLAAVGGEQQRESARPAADRQGDDGNAGGRVPWHRFYWTYLFAFAMGFGATIAEPALLAVAIKASEVSGGTLRVAPLRIVVAVGSGIGVTLGAVRILAGIPLPYFIVAGYAAVVVQTWFAPKQIVPLAFDSGGVTTSTVTVPLVTALGLGLASNVPGANPLVDGFGMIALAVLFPMLTVMGYAMAAQWRQSGST